MIKKILLFLLIPTLCYGATDYTQDANCQGAWLMHVDESPIVDSSTNSNTATLKASGEPNRVADTPSGYDAGSYDFDGSDDYLNVGDATELDISPDLTIVAWIKPDTTSDRNMIASKWDGNGGDRKYLFEINTGGTLRAYVSTDGTFQSGNTVSSTATISTSAWTHVAFVMDGSNTDMLIYINGSNDGSNTSGPATVYTAGAAEFHIGAEDDTAIPPTVNEFIGLMTEVGVFDKALSESEINGIKDNGLEGGFNLRRSILSQ